MSAKLLTFGDDARHKIVVGIRKLADALGPIKRGYRP